VRLALVSLTVCFGRTFTVFPRIFEARSTHVRWVLLDTRHPAAFLAVFRPWCQKLRSCGSPELRIFRPCLAVPRVYGVRSIAGCFRSPELGACPTRAVTPVKLPPYSTAGDFLGFSAFVLCIPHVTMYNLPMCSSNFIEIFIVRGLNCNSSEIWDSA
jgi:hypothetical protein